MSAEALASPEVEERREAVESEVGPQAGEEPEVLNTFERFSLPGAEAHAGPREREPETPQGHAVPRPRCGYLEG